MAGVQKLPSFSAPGNFKELNQQNQNEWSAQISGWMDNEIRRGSLTQFFNGTAKAYDQTQQGATITWNGFPNKIAISQGDDDVKRWKEADKSRNGQDEYLEWSLIRNSAGKIVRVVFTCEGPEYWTFFANKQKDTAAETIKALNKPLLDDVPKSNYFTVNRSDPSNESKWEYNPKNGYNSSTTTGVITHLVQGANTLGAEINIAAQATILRKKRGSGDPVKNSDQLIRCSQYGDPDRNSDPRIGYSINQLASQGNAVSVKDPVGLYMTKLDTGNLKLDRSGDAGSLEPLPTGTFTFQRGDISKQQGLRLRVQIPDGVKAPNGRQLTVSDIYDTKKQRHTDYGAQIADYITMGVHGVVIPGVTVAPRQFCPGTSIADQSFADMVPQLKASIAEQVSPFSRISDVITRKEE